MDTCGSDSNQMNGNGMLGEDEKGLVSPPSPFPHHAPFAQSGLIEEKLQQQGGEEFGGFPQGSSSSLAPNEGSVPFWGCGDCNSLGREGEAATAPDPPPPSSEESSDAAGGVSGCVSKVEQEEARVTSSTEGEEAAMTQQQHEDFVQQQQQQQQQPAFVNMALKQWSIYLGNMLLNYIQRECRSGQGGCGGQCQPPQQQQQQQQPDDAASQQYQPCAQQQCAGPDSNGLFASTSSLPSSSSSSSAMDSTTVTPTRFCPCCHYHTHMAAQQQQQQQQDMMPQQPQPPPPNLIGQPQQQQTSVPLQQTLMSPPVIGAVPHSPSSPQAAFHQGYYNYAANFSTYFAAQRARAASGNAYVRELSVCSLYTATPTNANGGRSGVPTLLCVTQPAPPFHVLFSTKKKVLENKERSGCF